MPVGTYATVKGMTPDQLRSLAVEIPDDWIFEAMALKLSRPALSYADAIGYTASRRVGARFLTGDEAFRRMPDVEFRT